MESSALIFIIAVVVSVPQCISTHGLFGENISNDEEQAIVDSVLRFHSLPPSMFNVEVETSSHLAEVDEKFLSIALPSSIVHEDFNMSNRALVSSSSGLSPAYLRVGGTSADFLIFNSSSKTVPSELTLELSDDLMWDTFQDENNLYGKKHFDNFSMSAETWDSLNRYTQESGWEMLFDLNVLLRNESQWDPSNAKSLLLYSQQQGYNQHLHFELGNEPDAFRHALNRSLSADQLGKDFLILNHLVKEDFAPYFKNSILVGPDITRPKKKTLEYLQTYLEIVEHHIDRITFHQYYCNGRNTSQAEFLSPKTLSVFPEQIALIKDCLDRTGYSKTPLWLGETSSCYGGGAPVLSESFIAGFLWADKLGQSAVHGIEVVFRQTLFKGHYSLLREDYYPLPDYWLSLLHKILMGRKVLAVKGSTRRVRLYAHCTQTKRSKYLTVQYPAGSVTVMAINLRNHSTSLSFNSSSSMVKHLYWLTPHGDKGLTSQSVNVNGKKISLQADASLPVFSPATVQAHSSIQVPPLSFGFIVLPKAKAAVCV